MRPLEEDKRKSLGKDAAAHVSPRIMAPSRFWAGVSIAGLFNAFQNASCSSALSRIVWSFAPATSR